MRIFLLIMRLWFSLLLAAGGWRATCGSAGLYYGNVTIGPRIGAILESGWEIRIQLAAPEASVGKSQRRKDPSSWISWSSTTI